MARRLSREPRGRCSPGASPPAEPPRRHPSGREESYRERPRSVGGRLLVPVVACAKAATLLITRSVVRNREFAIRIALGTTQGPPGVERLATSLGSA